MHCKITLIRSVLAPMVALVAITYNSFNSFHRDFPLGKE